MAASGAARVQQQAMHTVLAEHAVVLALAVLDVADDRVRGMLQVAPGLVVAPGLRLGFDQPIFPHQYLRWLGGVLQGDLGYSISTHRSIAYEIGSRLPQTLFLMITALTLATPLRPQP